MILFLTGTYGLGKSTLAKTLTRRSDRMLHIELDAIRSEMGASKPGGTILEDALNWKAYTRAVDASRQWAKLPYLVTIDSTGASERLAYLRYALGDLEQVLVRLRSSFPYMRCAQKWGPDTYSQAQFEHIQKLVMRLRPDHELHVDGKSADQLAEELLDLIGLAGRI
jgi:predicted kinase